MLERMAETSSAALVRLPKRFDVAPPSSWPVPPRRMPGWALTEAAKILKNYSFKDLGPHRVKEPVGVCGLITPWNWP